MIDDCDLVARLQFVARVIYVTPAGSVAPSSYSPAQPQWAVSL
jgi:hypothetical protein